jgi:hypothetical protein
MSTESTGSYQNFEYVSIKSIIQSISFTNLILLVYKSLLYPKIRTEKSFEVLLLAYNMLVNPVRSRNINNFLSLLGKQRCAVLTLCSGYSDPPPSPSYFIRCLWCSTLSTHCDDGNLYFWPFDKISFPILLPSFQAWRRLTFISRYFFLREFQR